LIDALGPVLWSIPAPDALRLILEQITMRKQYHLRQSPRGRLIWDVDRLVALSAGLPQGTVLLRDLSELDEPYWFQEAAHPPTCRAVADHARLILETDLRHPVILCAEGRVMDGMHRVAKAYLDGRESLPAVRFTETPEPDYIDVDIDALPYEDAG
jgi:hypothetical protein